ncbi:MAG: hypothetical protein ACYC27_18710 [Armatimonadota bacterium]
MIKLLEGIQTAYSGASGITTVSHDLFLNEAPQGTLMPYCTYQVVTNNPYFTFTGSIEDNLIQFSVFAKTASGTLSLYESLINLYDNTPLTVSGSSVIFMTRQSSTGLMKDPDSAGWMIHADYSIHTS